MMRPASVRKVKSADRTLDLLEYLAVSPGPTPAASIAAALGIPKSSLFHLIATLTERGYVAAGDDGYRIGPKVAELARGPDTGAHLGKLMGPVIEQLCLAINETCSFNRQSGDDAEVVITHSGQHSLSFTMKTGDLAPLYAVSSGKAMLALKDDAWLDEYLRRVRFDQFARNTIQSVERLTRDLERIRAEGFGTVDEEFTPGIVGIAMAVRQGETVVGAINVAIPSARYDQRTGLRIRQQIRKAAAQAEAVLNRAAHS